MLGYAGNKDYENLEKPKMLTDEYYSVEFSTRKSNSLYQFKIWNVLSEIPCVLVKENSEILGCLKVGDIFKMRYYTTDSLCPTTQLDTEIKYIKKEDYGRFKGHFLIGLNLLETPEDRATH